MRNLKDRFDAQWHPLRDGDCWIWLGNTHRDGYGQINIDQKTRAVHRVAYELYVGEIPENLFVLHKCDIKCCVNPDHLFLGTHADNMADMVAKRRQQHGATHPKAKITDRIALSIFRATGTYAEIAEAHGVTRSTVGMIKTKRQWKHIHEGVSTPVGLAHLDAGREG